MKTMDYCPRCRKRREHIHLAGIKLCKTCGHQEAMFKAKAVRFLK